MADDRPEAAASLASDLAGAAPSLAPAAHVLRSDAGHLPLPDDTVDLIVTSPPYFGLRSYVDGGEHYDGQVGDETSPAAYLDALLSCTAEWLRVLKPTGSLWVNLGDRYATRYSSLRSGGRRGLNGNDVCGRSGQNRTGVPEKSLIGLPWRYALRCLDELGLVLRAEVIWSKPNGLPESVTDRVRRSHETWFHFTLGPRYYADMDPIREPHLTKESPRPLGTRNATQRHIAATDNTGWKDHEVRHSPSGKIPSSVWTIPTQPLKVPEHLGIDHFAAFPTEWPRRIILGWSPPGGVVLDPFGGTGTTALVAEAHGRTGLSIDLSADYCRLARWRTTDPKQRAKVAPAPTQMSLDGVA